MKSNSRDVFWTIFVSAWLSMAGFVLVMVTTGAYGLGVTPDTVNYLHAARSFSVGEGFLGFSKMGEAIPLTHFPLLFPAVLSLGNYLGLDTLEWARVLMAFLFGVNIFLLSMIGFYTTGNRRGALLAGGLALIFVHIVEVHLMALSEPMFLTIILLFLGTLMRYLEKGNIRELILAGFLAGTAIVTRYSGVALLLTGVVVVMANSFKSGKEKWRDVFFFFMLAIIFPVLWFCRNVNVSGHLLAYPLGLSRHVFVSLGNGVNTLSEYLMPDTMPFAVRLVILGAFLTFSGVLAYKVISTASVDDKRSRAWLGLKVMGIFFVVYTLVAFLAIMFVDRGAVELDKRILIPLAVVSVGLVPVLMPRAVSEKKTTRTLRARMVFLIIFMVLMFLRTTQLVKNFRHDGFGYNGREWTQSSFVKTVKTLSDQGIVYSNDPEAFYFLTQRPSVLIPQEGRVVSYFSHPEEAARAFVEKKGLVVIFEEKYFRPDPLWWKFSQSASLVPLLRDGWGVIYGSPSLKHAK
ncbi:MAG: glycosyltransferase family 39 protein [Candidatus Omnitrophica bacterium]|nr:glycosyltransferase family 39 protein [Candidatus Omnitrophota bacterium]